MIADDRKKLLREFLEIYFLDNWRNGNPESFKALELIVSPHCNTKCSYCYYKNYGEELYHEHLAVDQTIIENSQIIFDYLVEENLTISALEIFSGEFFNLPYYKKILHQCEEYFTTMKIQGFISIPTNSTFLFDDKKTREIEEEMARLKSKNIHIHLSHSVDGKYLDNDTRQLRNGKPYTDEFYDKLFAFAEKHGTGFHPMVSAEGIEHWIQNYDWYIDNIIRTSDSFSHALRKLYLLEVRNPDWKVADLKYLEDFITHVVKDIFMRFGQDKEKFLSDFMFNKGFNMFSSLLFRMDRGIGCSEQTTLAVRLGDLAITPCHRMSYDGYNAGYLVQEEGKIVDIKIENPETFILLKTFDAKQGPGCQSCPISELCSLYCMGVNMEVNKDFFIPVSTVCRMEFVKVYALVKAYLDIGVMDEIISRMRVGGADAQVYQLEKMKEYILKEGK